MDESRWHEIERIFHLVSDLSQSEYEAVLDRECGDDPDLRAEIESLLAANAKQDDFLESPSLGKGFALLQDEAGPMRIGTSVSHYQIELLLGMGGMGEVFLARDTRLNRPVALKFLPAFLTGDEEVRTRFRREAEALSSISHPNVAHIYEVGTADGQDFLVMEYAGSTSLRDRLKKGRVPIRQAVDIASQVAQALDAAHSVGVVHRDIKPENIILGEKSLVKIIDFGVAKLTRPDEALRQLSDGTATTIPGMIIGTVRYMSPEQISGKEIDERSDIWSLGVVLCEMLAGKHPFARESNLEIVNAILNDDPAESLEFGEGSEPAIVDIVERCLAKDPRDRFSSASDLAFALETLSRASQRSLRLRPYRRGLATFFSPVIRTILFTLAFVALIAALYYGFGRSGRRENQVNYQQLTFQRGTVWTARFIPGSSSLVYNATLNGAALQLYSLRPPSLDARTLPLENASLLSISRNGEMAILLNETYLYQFIHRGTLARMAVDGSAYREIAKNVQEADWAPDGEDLAIIRWDDGRNKLEYPIGNVLIDTRGYLSFPRFSPDGSQIAYFDHATQWDNRGNVVIVDAEGKRVVSSDEWKGLEGLAWHGDEVWFTASKLGETFSLFAMARDGSVRNVERAPINLMLHDIASDGNTLMSRAIQQTDVYSYDNKGGDIDLSWLQLIAPGDLSADGSQFIFTHFGEGSGRNYSVYLSGTESGSTAVRLGEGRAMALSPDLKFAIAKRNVPLELTLLPTRAGDVIHLNTGNIKNFDRAAWFPDGRRIIFTGNETDRPKRSFAQDISTGEITPVTPEGVFGTLVSPDAHTLVVEDAGGRKRIFEFDDGQQRDIDGLAVNDQIIRWDGSGRALYVYDPFKLPIRLERLDLSNGRRTLVHEIAPANITGVFGNTYLFTTPDGQFALYGLRRYLIDLYLVQGLE